MSAASNYACESVQRSTGTNAKYLYAPAPEGTAEQVGQITQVLSVPVPNATNTNIAVSFPAGANGIYLLDAVCPLSPNFSITATGICLQTAANTYSLGGFNNTNVAVVTGNPVTAVAVVETFTTTAGQLNIYQNSGGALTYNLQFFKLATAATS
jgi:hypothetical protein